MTEQTMLSRFVQALTKSRLISLTLHMNMISGKAAPGLARAVSEHPTLKELHLLGFAFHFTKEIASKLKENKVLTKLTLRGGRYDVDNKFKPEALNDNGIKALSDLLLHNKTLTHLSLQGNILSPKHTEQLGAALARNNTLTSLDLSYCQLYDQEVVTLMTFLLPNHSLAHLDLKYNMFGSEGGKSIATLLQNSRSLKSLNLAGDPKAADTMEEGLSEILKALDSAKYLKELNLSGRKMDFESLSFFPHALEKNTSLHTVIINDCSIQASEMSAILTVLAKSKRFKSVEILKNNLNEECYIKIADWIKSDRVLQKLKAQPWA
ncbi:hypothetical protein BC829DRAFT_242448 [Chytridium lagenaria]|nr:hypothetical protein BC829DRAFT_242448 [Chytridium lagenaria]